MYLSISIFFTFSLINEFFAIALFLSNFKESKVGFKANKYFISFSISKLVIILFSILTIILFSKEDKLFKFEKLKSKKIINIFKYFLNFIINYTVVHQFFDQGMLKETK